ncbi:zinc-binding metallopeptidase family protein [Acidomonas methanolica]|uniref:zinc-binding metallopeptidase family protein n=1 Tax=Acidomonas methanolica TaxID=437 RepID=UPI002119D334|nr:putative zinc-binding peptidase [Acidomonas methanolica]MCQ9155394.1 putative zinc-binding peptidase [Acidomonas methanolica]
MRLFSCPSCGLTVFFENRHCTRCGMRLGYAAGEDRVVALVEGEGSVCTDVERGAQYRFCANAAYDACNWVVPAESAARFCLACRHNRTVPPLDDPANLARWQVLEEAKHRLIYTLLRLGLPMADRREKPLDGLVFDFLADSPDGERVMTGHADGVVTIALREADDVERERMRVGMGEYYRTVLGHFRHETGHYFWDVLVRDGGVLEEFRTLFGDERAEYGAALRRHYEIGPPSDWQERHVSAYATMHPWEDFAESWAHYLHMVDTLETGASYGLSTAPHVVEPQALSAVLDFDPFGGAPFEELSEAWLAMTSLLNSLNRAMGVREVYPFVLTAPVLGKMAFIHRLVGMNRRR